MIAVVQSVDEGEQRFGPPAVASEQPDDAGQLRVARGKAQQGRPILPFGLSASASERLGQQPLHTFDVLERVDWPDFQWEPADRSDVAACRLVQRCQDGIFIRAEVDDRRPAVSAPIGVLGEPGPAEMRLDVALYGDVFGEDPHVRPQYSRQVPADVGERPNRCRPRLTAPDALAEALDAQQGMSG